MDVNEELEKLEFGGRMIRVAEEDLNASFTGLSESAFVALQDALRAEYEQAGKPKALRKWLEKRLAPLFACVAERPIWLGGTPKWAFYQDKPMVFIRQFELLSSKTEATTSWPQRVLYVFALRVPTATGWTMTYRVMEDDPRFGVVAARLAAGPDPHMK